jgi:intraflagellar transport protein 88
MRRSERSVAGGGDWSVASKAMSVRPMTATSRAGYQSNASAASGGSPSESSTRSAIRDVQAQLTEYRKNSPTYQAEEMKKRVNLLLNVSAQLTAQKRFHDSLEKAKEAVREDKELAKYCQSNNVGDSQEDYLSFVVLFHLAVSFELNEQYEQAMSTYEVILKTQGKAPTVRNAHVNLGNLYYRKEDFQSAIKEFSAALDQLPDSQRKMGYLVSANIGKSYIKLGQYRNAITTFETIMSSSPDTDVGYNLVVCYYALGDVENMKRSFCALLGKTDGDKKEDLLDKLTEASSDARLHNRTGHSDALALREQKLEQEVEKVILKAARIISPCLDAEEWSKGYAWTLDQLWRTHESVANQLEIELSLEHMRRNGIPTAVKILKSFESKDPKKRIAAANNLSFVHFQEERYKEAEMYADQALAADPYNAKAKVNKANCVYAGGNFDGALSLYHEALALQPDCAEARYNLALVLLDKGDVDGAREHLGQFKTRFPNEPLAFYNIAMSLKEENQISSAIEVFELLRAQVPNDADVSASLAELYLMNGNEDQAHIYLLESLKCNPVNVECLKGLITSFSKRGNVEYIVPLLERLVEIQPKEIGLRKALGNSLERTGDKEAALEIYKSILRMEPENMECK